MRELEAAAAGLRHFGIDLSSGLPHPTQEAQQMFAAAPWSHDGDLACILNGGGGTNERQKWAGDFSQQSMQSKPLCYGSSSHKDVQWLFCRLVDQVAAVFEI